MTRPHGGQEQALLRHVGGHGHEAQLGSLPAEWPLAGDFIPPSLSFLSRGGDDSPSLRELL